MLEYFLEGISGGVAEYSYVPFRDESRRGLVRADVSDGSAVDFEMSGHPYEYDASVCVCKLLSRLEEYACAGKFEDHGFVVWG